jgi:hypothetical protein
MIDTLLSLFLFYDLGVILAFVYWVTLGRAGWLGAAMWALCWPVMPVAWCVVTWRRRGMQ